MERNCWARNKTCPAAPHSLPTPDSSTPMSTGPIGTSSCKVSGCLGQLLRNAALINNITCDPDPLTATVLMWLCTVTAINSLSSSFINGPYLLWALLFTLPGSTLGKQFFMLQHPDLKTMRRCSCERVLLKTSHTTTRHGIEHSRPTAQLHVSKVRPAHLAKAHPTDE